MKKLFQPGVFELIAPHTPWRSKAACMESGNTNWLSALQRLDMKNYLPLDILTKVDRMSMAHSIETRVPLLDHKLVEFAATIPPEMNLKNGTTKYVLKQAMRGILPDAIIDRPKHGFAVPLGYWFRGRLGPYVRDLLLGESASRRGLFNRSYIEGMVAQHEKGRNLDMQLWTLISFELWARVFLDRGAKGKACEAA
jgi:asparagine synthase (glutamine-hydrolysing)